MGISRFIKKTIGSFLSWVYKACLAISQAGYRAFPSRTRRVGARVISVGNITWGGTGKTPLAIRLAKELSLDGKRVAVLIRGWGDDEVDELKKKLPQVPVLVGRDRVRMAREAVQKHGAEILILDDGFQHLRLYRDVDVVTINATLPFGPGGLIPSGTLREPLEHLARAHVFILTKSNIGSKNLPWIRQKLLSIKPGAAIFEAVHKPLYFTAAITDRRVDLSELKGKKVSTLAGIGDPYSFEKTVENTGAQIVYAARFDDHHRYTRGELADFMRRSREIGAQCAVTTQKDFCRLGRLFRSDLADPLGPSFLILEIEFQVTDEEDFIRRCLDSERR